MTASFSYSTTFNLDKAHFNECYEQSNTVKRSFFKAGVLMAFGMFILLFTPVNPYAAWFIVALGILEAVSLHYHQPWWVMRQMFSRAAKGDVNITIDGKGVLSESHYNKSRILWSDLTEIIFTEKGYLLLFTGGKSYLSKSHLSEQAQVYITEKAKNLFVHK